MELAKKWGILQMHERFQGKFTIILSNCRRHKHTLHEKIRFQKLGSDKFSRQMASAPSRKLSCPTLKGFCLEQKSVHVEMKFEILWKTTRNLFFLTYRATCSVVTLDTE